MHTRDFERPERLGAAIHHIIIGEQRIKAPGCANVLLLKRAK